MDEFTITVKISGRSYRLKVNRDEEAGIRSAAEEINKSIKTYANNIAYKDEQDLLALVALEEKIGRMHCVSEKEKMEREVNEQLTTIDKLLSY